MARRVRLLEGFPRINKIEDVVVNWVDARWLRLDETIKWTNEGGVGDVHGLPGDALSDQYFRQLRECLHFFRFSSDALSWSEIASQISASRTLYPEYYAIRLPWDDILSNHLEDEASDRILRIGDMESGVGTYSRFITIYVLQQTASQTGPCSFAPSKRVNLDASTRRHLCTIDDTLSPP